MKHPVKTMVMGGILVGSLWIPSAAQVSPEQMARDAQRAYQASADENNEVAAEATTQMNDTEHVLESATEGALEGGAVGAAIGAAEGAIQNSLDGGVLGKAVETVENVVSSAISRVTGSDENCSSQDDNDSSNSDGASDSGSGEEPPAQ